MSRTVQQLGVTAFVMALLMSQGLAAESPAPSGLADRVVEAKGQFQPVTPQGLAERKKTLVDALSAMDAALAENAPDLVDPLKMHLKREALAQQLEKDAPDPAILKEILHLYSADQAGLELPAARETRMALKQYADAVDAAADKGLADTFSARMDDLAKRISQYQAKPTSEDRIAIGRTLGWLERSGQSPALVQAVRDHFSSPNLYAEVSQRLVSSAVSQDVEEVQGVRDCIMGTSIRGTARLDGQVSLEFAPDDQRAVLDLFLTGLANSSNVGYNGPVKIYSTGRTNVWARKRVYIDVEGLVGDRAVADCSTSSRINSVSANCGLIRRVAWKKAKQSQRQAERVASTHAESRVARGFNGRVAEMLDKANVNFTDRLRNPLLRRDAFPNTLKFSTTEDQLQVVAVRAGASQTAAASPPPNVDGQYDLAVRVHDSLVINIGESLIGGETLTDETVVKMFEDAKLEVPEELRITQESEPWAITFVPESPLAVQFSEQRISIVLQGRQFKRNNQVIRDTMNISASYVPATNADGMTFRRDGDVVVEYAKQTRQSMTMLTMKSFMRSKFNAIFKPELDPKKLNIPGPWSETSPVRLAQALSGNGWLTLGWNQVAVAETPAEQVAQVQNQSVSTN